MEPAVVILIVVVAVGLFVTVAYLSHLHTKKRREALAAWAESRGLRFSPDKVTNFEQRFPAFDRLRTGKGRYAHNISTGPIPPMPDGTQRHWATPTGGAVVAFDYHYYTESTDSKGRKTKTHHHFSAVVIETRMNFHPLLIRPENVFDKFASFFGKGDINFESAEFSRKFFVRCPHRRWAYDIITPATMEFLLSREASTIEMELHYVAIHRGGTFNVERFETSLQTVLGLLDRIPRDVAASLHNNPATSFDPSASVQPVHYDSDPGELRR